MTETNPHELRDLIRLALREDIGDGDHSSLSCVPETATKRARLLVKQAGVLAGVEVALVVFDEVDPALKVEVKIQDGARIEVGDIVLTVEGSARSILQAERLMLNIMQRMSGIATYTRSMVDLIADLPVKLLDTRKTTPNFRLFEKMATRIGGAHNHRMGLYDMIMLKDNHLDYAGGIQAALVRAHQYLEKTGRDLKIEIETRNLGEVDEVLRLGGADIVMLDNFSLEDMREAVRKIGGRIETEASGNINETTLRAVAETGVDSISSGALTHQIKSLDLSLKAF
ncbi:carboxylating nicotinate-nucleotide diphosphorylase [Persicitalea jodogahamensis]|uniref:Probable nicotinate-nucleotide pyrophosphorylase [carboxylating] n=1 Tax=Persicitalea jodogahamensis TaxID=402147 RepID=A0A8J3D2Z6_9BACT|nr:carboxylating nicotinate-nucleotide diphosphorylase [Persicitalea jodogahamensis]GHB51974.1 nicotinate-nucleotide diphosphorylase (carboxylating) [Persicitalea jodogahamensis]